MRREGHGAGLPDEIGTLTVTGTYAGNGGSFFTRVGGSPDSTRADFLQLSGSGATATGSTPQW